MAYGRGCLLSKQRKKVRRIPKKGKCVIRGNYTYQRLKPVLPGRVKWEDKVEISNPVIGTLTPRVSKKRKVRVPLTPEEKAERQKRAAYNKRLRELRSMPYEDYLHTVEWEATRQRALEHHGRYCHDCWATAFLEVHHLTYDNKGREKMGDLAVLCDKCHEKRHAGQRGVRGKANAR